MGNAQQRIESVIDASSASDETPLELNEQQTRTYERHGYLLLDGLFSAAEIERLRTCVAEVTAERNPRVVLEAQTNAVRSVYGVHQHHRVFGAFSRNARLVQPVRQVLRGDIYVYQSKLNTKSAFDGDQWPWHQDYVYWQKEDGMPEPHALTAAVFLDDMTDINGALMLVPGSHRGGVLSSDTYDGKPPGYEDAPGFISNLTAKMKYTIPKETLVRLTREGGIVAPKARAGSVLLFHCNIAHASPANLSHLGRTLALFTYNRVDNAPPAKGLHRPDFLVSRDTRPIVPVLNDAF